jgi:NADPH:quinone reductase
MPVIPHLMQALVAEGHGEPPRLVQVSTPRPAAGEVLIRVAASAVNPLDIKILAGAAGHAHHSLPAILGIDVAGIVAAVGEAVTAFSPGDAVYGMTGGVGGHPGSLAEYQAADTRLLARKPVNLTMREAAALPLAFITAWEGLVDRATIRQGQNVLVQGGAGGVGQMVLQIARAHGATSFATGSPAARNVIEQLGAVFVDRAQAPVELVQRHTGGQGFDIVFDTSGGASLDAAFAMVRALRPCRQRAGLGHTPVGATVFPRSNLLRHFHLASLADRPRPRASRRNPCAGDEACGSRRSGSRPGPTPFHAPYRERSV